MGNVDRPVDLATFTTWDCHGCDWLLMADGAAAVEAAQLAAEVHSGAAGHDVGVLTYVQAADDAPDVLGDLLPPHAVAIDGGYAVSKAGPGE